MDKRKAWYLDDGILIEGFVLGNQFYPNTKLCGFDVQEFDNSRVDREVFFDLQKAIVVFGHLPIV